jgi:hypothetical protein
MFRSLLPLAVLIALPATAQEEAPDAGRATIYRDVEHLEFDQPVAVEGELLKPKGVVIVERKRAAFSPMVALRDSFAAEMKGSIDEVK